MDKQVKAALIVFMWCAVLVFGSWSFGFSRDIFLEFKRPMKPVVFVIEGSDGLKALKWPDGRHQLLPGRKPNSYQFRATDGG